MTYLVLFLASYVAADLAFLASDYLRRNND